MSAALSVAVGQTVISGESVSSGPDTHIQMAASHDHLWLQPANSIKSTKSRLMIVDPMLNILYLWRNVVFGQLGVKKNKKVLLH